MLAEIDPNDQDKSNKSIQKSKTLILKPQTEPEQSPDLPPLQITQPDPEKPIESKRSDKLSEVKSSQNMYFF